MIQKQAKVINKAGCDSLHSLNINCDQLFINFESQRLNPVTDPAHLPQKKRLVAASTENVPYPCCDSFLDFFFKFFRSFFTFLRWSSRTM